MALAAPNAIAQVQATSASRPLAFEVVSIRPTKFDHESKSSFGPTPDGFRMVSRPLIGLFQIAYVPNRMDDSGFFRGSRISGAPDWLSRSECFDVAAKVSEANIAEWQKPASQPEMLRTMMRALLEERLKAIAHIENKELPVFDLVVARGGPKFKAAETVDSAELRTRHPASVKFPDGGAALPAGGMRQVNFFGVSIATLTPILSYLSGRPVEDKTGLTGRYDFSIQMNFNLLGAALENATKKAGSSVDAMLPPPPPPGTEGGSVASPSADSETSIFTVVQEQLGLRLEPAKGTVETLVIDHVERPSKN